ncbi:MAG: hypothetical protein ACRDDY_03755 [Clostridium sp.]
MDKVKTISSRKMAKFIKEYIKNDDKISLLSVLKNYDIKDNSIGDFLDKHISDEERSYLCDLIEEER